MAEYTITTTETQEAALQYAFTQAQLPSPPPWAIVALPTPATVAAYLQQHVDARVLGPMVSQHTAAKDAELTTMLASVPPENRAAAQADIEADIEAHGGTVPLRDARYVWSDNTAPPPPNTSVAINVSQANVATVSRLFFDHLDADNVDRMERLMALRVGAVVRIVDPRNTAHYLEVLTTAAPLQQGGATGHVEIPVQYRASGGPLAALFPMDVTFS